MLVFLQMDAWLLSLSHKSSNKQQVRHQNIMHVNICLHLLFLVSHVHTFAHIQNSRGGHILRSQVHKKILDTIEIHPRAEVG